MQGSGKSCANPASMFLCSANFNLIILWSAGYPAWKRILSAVQRESFSRRKILQTTVCGRTTHVENMSGLELMCHKINFFILLNSKNENSPRKFEISTMCTSEDIKHWKLQCESCVKNCKCYCCKIALLLVVTHYTTMFSPSPSKIPVLFKKKSDDCAPPFQKISLISVRTSTSWTGFAFAQNIEAIFRGY